LRNHLKGSAGNWFETYEDKFTTCDAFVDAFSAFYGLQNLQIQLRHDLRIIKQGPKEEVRAYNMRFQQLNQQLKRRDLADSIYFYINGLNERAREHIYVNYRFDEWNFLDTIMVIVFTCREQRKNSRRPSTWK